MRSTTEQALDAAGRRIVVVAAVNDEQVLAQNLAASPLLRDSAVPLLAQRGYASAASAYNAALTAIGADADVAVLTHQDVYLPRGWDTHLLSALRWLEQAGERWGVLSVFGITEAGREVGTAWSSGLRRQIGTAIDRPVPVVAMDEMLLVLNVRAGLKFDERLPGFHMYAADIVLTARQLGLGAFVFQGPVVHNSVPVRRLDATYRAAYWFLRRKWWDILPVPTCIAPLTRSPWPLAKRWWCLQKRSLLGRTPVRPRLPSPSAVAAENGYERPVEEAERRQAMERAGDAFRGGRL